MKLSQILNEEDRIPNPLGHPPADLSQLFQIFDDIEGEFISGLYDTPHLSGPQFVQGMNEIRAYGTVKNVDISHLIPVEPTLSKSHLEDILHSRDRKQSSATPVAYLYDGHLYVIDGNHRVAAAYLSGEKSISINVVDLAKIQHLATSFKSS